MAKKSESVKAFEFIFEGNALKTLLNTNPKKVLFTVKIESEITKDARKVGAMKIYARGIPKTKTKSVGDGELEGCPIPPCRV